MSKNSNKAWNTRYGARRVRDEAPTLAEAIFAAQGLSDNLDEQVEIAASLMGLPQGQVRADLMKAAPTRKIAMKSVVVTGPRMAPRAVAVERKPARRVFATSDRAGRPAFTSSRGI